MPEAVIVATARTPIGRAFKGSLVDVPPRRPRRPRHQGGRGQGARRSTRRTIEDVILGCGQPGGEAGLQHRPGRRAPGRHRRPRRHRQPVLLVVAADDPHGRPRHQGRRGRRVRRRRRRDRRAASSSAWPTAARTTPLFADAEARTAERAARASGGDVDAARRACPTSTSPWARRPRTSPSSRTSPARRWTSSPPAPSSGPSPPRSAASSSGRSPRSPRPTAPSCQRRRRPPARHHRREAGRRCKPAFRPDGKVTAGNACPLNDGAAAVVVMSDTQAERARHHAARPHRVVSGVSALDPEIMGLGPIEACRQALARAGLTIDDDRPGRDQRGVRRPGPPVGQAPRHRHRRQAERQRRRHRPRPPVRHDRRPHHDHAASTASRTPTAATASRPCASAAARAWP